MHACQEGRTAVVEYLLQKTASVRYVGQVSSKPVSGGKMREREREREMGSCLGDFPGIFPGNSQDLPTQ